MIDRRLTLLVALGIAALALTSASPMAPSGHRATLRGGAAGESSSAGERIVHVGLAEEGEDANEPFMREESNPSATTFSSSDSNGPAYNADWSAARVELTEIIKEREAAASATKGLRLRGGAAEPQEAKGGMVAVNIKMTAHHIHPINSPPVKVVICGSGPELGEWDVSKAIELKSVQRATESFSGEGMFPVHQGTIMLPAGKAFEFKYAVTLEDMSGDHKVKTQWEAVNRQLTTPKTGSLDIRSEFMEARDSDPRITDEPFQCNAQEWSRYYMHHISPLVEVQPGREG